HMAPSRLRTSRRSRWLVAAALVACVAHVAAAAPICDALALCPAGVDPCTITGAKTIGEACTLDFGTRSITIVGNLTAERSGGSFSIQAGALTLTGSLLAVGSMNDLGGSITIDVAGAFVMTTSGPRINVNGENGGGDVTVTAHSIDVDAGAPAISGRGTGTFGDGGTITLEAQDLLRVSGSLDVGGGGAT